VNEYISRLVDFLRLVRRKNMYCGNEHGDISVVTICSWSTLQQYIYEQKKCTLPLAQGRLINYSQLCINKVELRYNQIYVHKYLYHRNKLTLHAAMDRRALWKDRSFADGWKSKSPMVGSQSQMAMVKRIVLFKSERS
jgi:hypothetical protein